MLQAGAKVVYEFRKKDAGYLVPATGQIEVNGLSVKNENEAKEHVVDMTFEYSNMNSA